MGVELKAKAQILRRQGKTFGEIQNLLGAKIPKSTLSGWCRGVKLPMAFRARLEKINYLNLRRGRELAIKLSREARQNTISRLEGENAHIHSRIDKNVGKIILASLYLGEGAKTHRMLVLGNSDPGVIRLFLRLLKKCYGVDNKRIKCRISYRADQNIKKLTQFWSKNIGIPVVNFYKTVPDIRTIGRATKKKNYMGVCVIYVLGSSQVRTELDIIAKLLMKGH